MKKKNLLIFALTAALTFSTVCLAACGPKEPAETPVTPPAELEDIYLPVDDAGRTTNVHVHDPSVFQDPADGKYYVFGSHYAVASSSDLIVWKQEVNDNEDTKLFGSQGVVKAMPETLKLAGGQKDAWAPDVECFNNKYYMYISFTTGFGANTSVISRVEADDVLGPYSNETVIVESVTSHATDKPNCIDPELFYDKNGGLWMVYGSFYGGVYIKELHNSGANWGLPKEEGFGKLLWKNGYRDGVEGPYAFYDAATDYYYLMISEGDLFSVYNMRIARSKTPDGPYLDSNGKDVATAEGTGNKLAGNYHFQKAGSQPGFAALGHNSVIKNDKGEFFVVYHARRMESANKATTGHSLYVSQLFFNEDGWPVMAPNAYVGEELGKVKATDVVGDFDLLLHSEATEVTAAESKAYTFAADGKVLDGTTEAGTWTLSGDYYITIVLDGVTYKGVVAPAWDMYSTKANQAGIVSITAVSNAGRALWAIAK